MFCVQMCFRVSSG